MMHLWDLGEKSLLCIVVLKGLEGRMDAFGPEYDAK